MKDWIQKLDEFLIASEKQLLHTAGSISADQAEAKAMAEYEKYRVHTDKKYVSDFDREIQKLIKSAKK